MANSQRVSQFQEGLQVAEANERKARSRSRSSRLGMSRRSSTSTSSHSRKHQTIQTSLAPTPVPRITTLKEGVKHTVEQVSYLAELALYNMLESSNSYNVVGFLSSIALMVIMK